MGCKGTGVIWREREREREKEREIHTHTHTLKTTKKT